MILYNSLEDSEKLFCNEPETYYETTAFFLHHNCMSYFFFMNDRDRYSDGLIFFHGRSIFKTFLQAWKPLKIAVILPISFQTIMDKSLGTLLHFWVFCNSHRSNPSPYTTNNVGCMYPEFFSEFQLCIGWREGELQENFENAALPRLVGDWVETLLLPAFFRENLSATYNAH